MSLTQVLWVSLSWAFIHVIREENGPYRKVNFSFVIILTDRWQGSELAYRHRRGREWSCCRRSQGLCHVSSLDVWPHFQQPVLAPSGFLITEGICNILSLSYIDQKRGQDMICNSLLLIAAILSGFHSEENIIPLLL